MRAPEKVGEVVSRAYALRLHRLCDRNIGEKKVSKLHRIGETSRAHRKVPIFSLRPAFEPNPRETSIESAVALAGKWVEPCVSPVIAYFRRELASRGPPEPTVVMARYAGAASTHVLKLSAKIVATVTHAAAACSRACGRP